MRLSMVMKFIRTLVLAAALVATVGGTPPALCAGSLTLAQSIPLALTHSSQVRLAEIALAEAEKSHERASLLPGNRKAVQSAADAVEIAKLSLAAARDDVAARVEQAYFAVLVADGMLAIRSKAYQTASQQLNTGKAKLKAGILKQADVDALVDNLMSAQYSLAAAKSSKKITELKFNAALTRSLDSPVVLSDRLDYKPVKLVLADAHSSALTNRKDVIQARYAVQRRKEDYGLSKNEFTPLVEQEQAKWDYEKAQINLDETMRNVRIAVEEAYANVINAQNEIDNKTRAVRRAKLALDQTDGKYKVGLARATDLIAVQSNYESAQLSRLQSVNDCRTALAAFYRTIGKSHPALAGK